MNETDYWFKARFAWGKCFDRLSDSEIASLVKAIWKYAETGEAAAVEGNAAIAWPMIINDISRDRMDRENGKMGGRPPKTPDKTPDKTPVPHRTEETEKQTEKETEKENSRCRTQSDGNEIRIIEMLKWAKFSERDTKQILTMAKSYPTEIVINAIRECHQKGRTDGAYLNGIIKNMYEEWLNEQQSKG